MTRQGESEAPLGKATLCSQNQQPRGLFTHQSIPICFHATIMPMYSATCLQVNLPPERGVPKNGMLLASARGMTSLTMLTNASMVSVHRLTISRPVTRPLAILQEIELLAGALTNSVAER